jgi:transcription-repair coupling factor (superfamily II helicase)
VSLNLSGLLPLLTENEIYRQVTGRLAGSGKKTYTLELSGLSGAARPAFFAAIQDTFKRPLLVWTARPSQTRTLVEQICFFSRRPELVLSWPTPDTLPYERIEQDKAIISGRIATLAAIYSLPEESRNNLLVVASAKALMQPTLSPEDFQTSSLVLKKGQRLELNRVLGQLVRLGYEAESLVEQPGQFSRRGGILDLFPVTDNDPVRLELFGDEIESLRRFDSGTQRSHNHIEEVRLNPPGEVPLWRSDEALERLSQISINELRPEVQEEWQRILAHLENRQFFEGIEQFMPYFYPQGQLFSLFDHLPPESLVVFDGPSQIFFALEELSGQAESLREELERQGEIPAALVKPYIGLEGLQAKASGFDAVLINRLDEPEDRGADKARLAGVTIDRKPDDSFSLGLFKAAPEYVGQLDRLIEDMHDNLKAQQRLVVVSQQAERLREQFEDKDLFPILQKKGAVNGLANPPSPGSLHLLSGGLLAGWRAPGLDLIVLTDREIFGWTKQVRRGTERTEGTRRTQSQREAFLRELKPGDYVVHIEHGIARYEGLVKFRPEGNQPGAVEREFLFLRYAENDRLFVPIEQVDRVLPYTAPGQATPTLHRLSSGEWLRTKRKVRSHVEDIAQELLRLYSQRATRQRQSYSPDTGWQREMEDAFPFTETPDQVRAISDMKTDMESEKPMDRLICGDVGYGKTEVALRGAFKAVMDGRQVAVLVPTTILAQQHHQTFKQRLTAFPTEIEVLSRFRSKKEQEKVVERLARGEVDIVIGTHRLLQKDIIFKNLGLLIIDEEQRFGVKHKERLKQMKQDVDVLTLSATPIPRTLYMSLTGVRDMSVIETPPEARLPVKTYVTAFSDTLVKEAILRELERGGQVFYVHNRVQSIAQAAVYLKNLIPQARVIVGHGQMDEHELEKVMLAFTEGEADVLVCTTIIESGLDIPNANTLIIDNAIMYGLAQLYQLRGRVGRGANRGYAYFLYRPGTVMSEDAQKRLDTMLDTQELGAGFKIAMKDLEIRGAGNLLGAEQSGQIAAVGFELYVRLLEEAIEEVKGAGERPIEALVEAPTVNLSLPLPAFLPEDYVQDQAVRLDMYRKLAQPLQSATQIRELMRELEDRFGALPEPARNLIYLLDIKVLAIRAGVESIIEQEGEIFLRWPAPSLETEMRRKVSKPTQVREKPRPSGRANVDPRRLMKEFGDALRISPNQMRLNMRILRDNWQTRLKNLLEELSG